MKSDLGIKQDVSDELLWEPAVDAATIGVEVDHGVVTLSGHVRSYVEKLAAEHAAERVAGVRGVVQKLDVRLAGEHRDEDVAAAARGALEWHASLPSDRITVLVENGWVTLSGDVDWAYQSELAEQAVGSLRGVAGLINRLAIRQRVAPEDVARQISAALRRHAEREASHIHVTVNGGTVTLSGRIGSAAERRAAKGAAWAAPGVTAVIDQLDLAS
ncbi:MULTISPECIES: BON domain-containing protein [Ralstonia solanacearum species complex]|uniref:BON domain-containing protein n=2 Tax=Ralstonia solanacearum species complex TaxID=3116862 RepID=A0AAD0S8J8_RALSL|nr:MULTISPECIES: BON domain-containing protein [Ralstonia solanacearum species complex]AXV81325.1 BON domain-containing protein [Ralstonia solanacearum]AXW52462.1 BON domain-containing protein [Ralstonia solanacearum]QUP53586.1 BON domain-containing protein [Ralstonia syzygii]CBJ50910.1 putative transport associated protein [Ralstonia solanacearum PSI07]